MLIDFDRLQHQSEYECVPVPYLDSYHNRTLGGDGYDQLLAAMLANPGVPLPPLEALLKMGGDSGFAAKVAAIKNMTEVSVDLVRTFWRRRFEEVEAFHVQLHRTLQVGCRDLSTPQSCISLIECV